MRRQSKGFYISWRGPRKQEGREKRRPRETAGSKKKEKEPEEVDSDDKIDLSSETNCRLCDNKKEFKPNTEALAKHYALAHFKASLEGEIKGGDNVCNICKVSLDNTQGQNVHKQR